MKRLLLIKLFLFLALPLWASPLDLIDSAPGTFWGKADASANNADANHMQFITEQGVKFTHMDWVTWYVSLNWWQNTGISKTNFWSYGVKNDTFIPHLTLGVEEENYVFSTPPVASNAFVGYVSCNFDWDLKKETNNHESK